MQRSPMLRRKSTWNRASEEQQHSCNRGLQERASFVWHGHVYCVYSHYRFTHLSTRGRYEMLRFQNSGQRSVQWIKSASPKVIQTVDSEIVAAGDSGFLRLHTECHTAMLPILRMGLVFLFITAGGRASSSYSKFIKSFGHKLPMFCDIQHLNFWGECRTCSQYYDQISNICSRS